MSRAQAGAHTTLELYERWAPLYPPAPHNALMRVEQAVMLDLLPALAGTCALDLACGTGRYARQLLEGGAGMVVATDFSPAMLRNAGWGHKVRAGLGSLPFA